jgi:hypothetical protein
MTSDEIIQLQATGEHWPTFANSNAYGGNEDDVVRNSRAYAGVNIRWPFCAGRQRNLLQ